MKKKEYKSPKTVSILLDASIFMATGDVVSPDPTIPSAKENNGSWEEVDEDTGFGW